MNNIKELVEYGVLGLLLALSVWAVAIAIDRFYHYRRIDVAAWDKRVELEADLTAGLTTIATVAANAPYVGLLGTVLGIMLTFQTLGLTGDIDVKTIMTGLALALKATAAGLLVAMPCVALNNALRRRVKLLLA
ncbi:MAG: TonB-system energizer ExbB, partial [Candidatus Competibacter sp.]